MKSVFCFVGKSQSVKEAVQDKEFIAKHGDLRPSPTHRQHGRQYFDSADWSMYKDDDEIGKQLRLLPRMSEKRPTPKCIRKSTFSRDSAKSLPASPMSAHGRQ